MTYSKNVGDFPSLKKAVVVSRIVVSSSFPNRIITARGDSKEEEVGCGRTVDTSSLFQITLTPFARSNCLGHRNSSKLLRFEINLLLFSREDAGSNNIRPRAR